MSAYGKLVVKIEVLDPSVTGDEENVFTKGSRMVTLFTRHGVNYTDANRLASAFVETNVADARRSDLSVMWYPDPVRIGVWGLGRN